MPNYKEFIFILLYTVVITFLYTYQTNEIKKLREEIKFSGEVVIKLIECDRKGLSK